MDFITRIMNQRKEEHKFHWEGNFTDYINIVKQNPDVAQTAHSRVYKMIESKGIENPLGDQKYNFFSSDIFGLNQTINRLMDEYFHPAAKRLDVKKRILLLMGPVSGGKSTIANLLKKGLEEYTKTDKGAVYGIKDCPMHEDPLHLIPNELRRDFEKEYGIRVEGNLCPLCQLRLKNEYLGQVEKVRIERIIFSEEKRVGIGTFFPSDPKSQDISDLTGSIDFSTIAEYGSESDPRAYRFDGELNKANRGIMEFQEILKADEKFLWNLLSLTQEGNFKAGRFSLISADELVIAHTNEAEYLSFYNNKKNESLQSRIIVIPVPYNLQLDEEVAIYKKLIDQSDLKDVHIAPYTLNTVAIFSILTRLKESKNRGVNLLTKLRLYNSENANGFNQSNVEELRKEFHDEGMFGIDPRFVVNRLSSVLIHKDKKCINSLDVLKSLKEGIELNLNINKAKKEKYLQFLSIAREEYDKNIGKDIQKIFSYYFKDAKNNLMENYLENVEIFINKSDRTPNEQLMRVIEEEIGILELVKYPFREEVLFKANEYKKKGKKFNCMSHNQLREGIERKLYSDFKKVLRISHSNNVSEYFKIDTIEGITEKLIKEYGYCQVCAKELLTYQTSLLNI